MSQDETFPERYLISFFTAPLSKNVVFLKDAFLFQTFLVSVMDLPFSISPVVVGLMLMLLYGRQVSHDLEGFLTSYFF